MTKPDESNPKRPEATLASPPTGEQITLGVLAGGQTQPQGIPGTGRDSPLATSAVSLLHEPPATLGPYEILEKLGEGGMGTVYKARHTRLKKLVAVKILPPAATRDPAALARFGREMEAVGKLEHPNIVRATDADEQSGTHYLVMEFVDGIDLQKLVKQQGPLAVAAACDFVRQAAIALAHAHENGLVHRDIKPSNLLVTRQGQVKLLDLGLARLGQDETGEGLTDVGSWLGTPDYMAPEQWTDTHRVDHRCDLYALGCTLYFLLTGRTPYGGEARSTALSKMAGHATESIPSLARARPNAPAELDRLFHQLLAKQASARLSSAAELAKRLEPFCQTSLSPIGFTSSGTSGASIPQTLLAASAQASGGASTSGAVHHGASGRWGLWIALAFGGLALWLGIWVIIRDKNGKEISRVKLPEGGSAQIEQEKIDNPKASGAIGWQGWPADAPPPAIAPFSADQARRHQAAWAEYLNTPVEYTNSIGMKFRLIPPGEFMLGSPPLEIAEALRQAGQDNRLRTFVESEGPQRRIIIAQPIYLGEHEVTQQQYEKITGVNPSYFSAKGPGKAALGAGESESLPVEMVSWNDAVDFCVKLSQHDKLKPHYFREKYKIIMQEGTGYRLPTEAEWEFACRAGTKEKFWFGEHSEDLVRAGWFGKTAAGRTHQVGELKANPWGLYDVHGNVWEWTQDIWLAPSASQTAEQGAEQLSRDDPSLPLRAIRGGGWQGTADRCRSAHRHALDPTVVDHDGLGFRVALAIGARPTALNEPAVVANKTGTVDIIPLVNEKNLGDGNFSDVTIHNEIMTLDATNFSNNLWINFPSIYGDDWTFRAQLRLIKPRAKCYAKLIFMSNSKPELFALFLDGGEGWRSWIDASDKVRRWDDGVVTPWPDEAFVDVSYAVVGDKQELRLGGKLIVEAPREKRYPGYLALNAGGCKMELKKPQMIFGVPVPAGNAVK